MSEAVVAFSKADANQVSADVPAPADLLDVMKNVQDRLTKLESRNTRGLLSKLFGKGSVAAVLLAVFLIGGTAWAREHTYAVTVFGVDGVSCGNWTEQKTARPTPGRSSIKRLQFEQWLGGYLSAYSLWVERGSGPVNNSEHVGAIAWIDNYCQENPLKNLAWAAEQLIYAIE